jgi:hypothetical protein
MKLRNITLILFLVLSACGGASGGGAGQGSENTEYTNDLISHPSVNVEGPIVKIEYKTPEGLNFIKVEEKISSHEELLEYKRIKDQETQKILEETRDFPEDVNYPSVVTFKEPVAQTKIDEIANAGSAAVTSIRYVSSRGGGQIPYEMLGTQAVMDMESALKEVQKRDNNIDDFHLFRGFSAFKGGLNRGAIESLMGDRDTFVVDIGPAEIYENGGVQASWDDVSSAVKRYGAK